ncbi:phosphatase [Celerinatantimonas sp. MCCC 1A17872]|uniref:phosphatase n=1 Tax=Celerinatantimonas sp. MCCC 1A17872 TaxID=3177514 RepID=UPI0038C8052B
MKVMDGDLITLAEQGKFDVIVHGCNCFNDMSHGIAATIKEHFPEAYMADQDTTPGDRNKLGTFTSALIERNGHQFTVVNAYTQYGHVGDGNVDYEALQIVFAQVKQHFHNLRIAYPLIGAGRGGGNWELLEKIIDQQLEGEDHTLIRYEVA